MSRIKDRIQHVVPLAPLTNIGLGGHVSHMLTCRTTQDVLDGLSYAREHNLPVYILGGGSNTIFPDEDLNILVLHLSLTGISFTDEGDTTLIHAGAGEEWDAFVAQCIKRNLAGIECLSGIPGLVGATPIQNVGAYGQEVKDTIQTVHAIDRETHEEIQFSNEACRFAYRSSIFKYEYADRYIVTRVVFRLKNDGKPTVAYPQLKEEVAMPDPTLSDVRNAVLTLRSRKSMVADPTDPHSRSCGSFFMNPILSETEYAARMSLLSQAPRFRVEGGYKVPAAHLIEQSGFQKGYTRGGVGISPNHTLALVNYGGTTQELLFLAEEIQQSVYDTFQIRLVPEPVIVR